MEYYSNWYKIVGIWAIISTITEVPAIQLKDKNLFKMALQDVWKNLKYKTIQKIEMKVKWC